MSKKIIKVLDKSDSYKVNKKNIFSLPMRLVVVGKSQLSGKTNLIVNLLARKQFYYKDFKGENIFIISPSIKNDQKLKNLIKYLKIPDGNIMMEYDEDMLNDVYDMIDEEYQQAVEDKKKPPHFLFYFDDMGFSGKLRDKQNNFVARLFMNGRHLNISSIVACQSYKQIAPQVRENLTGLVVFQLPDKNLEAIIDEHNYLHDKKEFKQMFRQVTSEPHSFFVVNYNNPLKTRYLNSSFEPIETI